MNNFVDSPSPRRGIRSRLHIGAAVAALAFVPLAGKSLEVTNGLSVTTTPSSNLVYGAAAVGVNNTVAGANSFAAGEGNYLLGYEGNFASGKNNWINGWSNGAIGNGNTIRADGNGGYQSFAWGIGNQTAAHVSGATVGGYHNIINGSRAQAIGILLTNNSYGSMVVGQCNKPDTDAAAQTSWRAGDSLFVIGNGTGDAANLRSNALVVTKGGTAIFSQPVILQGNAIAGDIPMYTGN